MLMIDGFNKVFDFFLTQEVEFSRKGQGVSIRNKRVVPCILWLHVINKQSMKPDVSDSMDVIQETLVK